VAVQYSIGVPSLEFLRAARGPALPPPRRHRASRGSTGPAVVSRIVDPLSRSVTLTVELSLLWRKAARRSARPAPHDD